ncbi:hypothetical protein, partial [Limosilactobacillus reuteri]|uniref:hypothetical protein n=1 Tax=Limosilactobacillus reuteri TaxID=1598 RepID=UPI00207D26B7
MQKFFDEMSSRGIIPLRTFEVLTDDRWHRFMVHGDRGTQKTGYYRMKLAPNGVAVGNYGQRREGVTYSYFEAIKKVSK